MTADLSDVVRPSFDIWSEFCLTVTLSDPHSERFKIAGGCARRTTANQSYINHRELALFVIVSLRPQSRSDRY